MFIEGKVYVFTNAHNKRITVLFHEVYVDVFAFTVTCENLEYPYEEFVGTSELRGFEKALRKAIRKCNNNAAKGFYILRRQIKIVKPY